MNNNNNNNNNTVVVNKVEKESSSKAQPCPHCHREFTNLRHHINQQHMQVPPPPPPTPPPPIPPSTQPSLSLYNHCRLRTSSAQSAATAAIWRPTWRGTSTTSTTSSDRPAPSVGRSTATSDNMWGLSMREPRLVLSLTITYWLWHWHVRHLGWVPPLQGEIFQSKSTHSQSSPEDQKYNVWQVWDDFLSQQ